MELPDKELSDEHGSIWYGLQFNRPVKRSPAAVINAYDDSAAAAICDSMPTFGGNEQKRSTLTEAIFEMLLRTASDRRKDVWVGWRYIKAVLKEMPEADATDLIWMALVERRVEEAVEGVKT